MLAALFSFSLTSCIDDEVDPIVEAIYANQANLIAAQAAVQNANADLLEAQATVQESIAAMNNATAAATEANTANNQAVWAEQLRLLMANNDKLINDAQIALADAQLDWEILMVGLMADLEAAGAVEAAAFAATYIAHMGTVNTATNDLLLAQADLATAELLIKDMGTDPNVSYDYFMDMLNTQLGVLNANVAAAQASIAGYEAAMANPSATETQIADNVAQIATLNARLDELNGEVVTAAYEKYLAGVAVTDATAWMHATTGPYAVALDALTTAKTNQTNNTNLIASKTAAIASLNAAIADYAGTKAAFKDTLDAAVAVIGAAEDDNHPSGHAAGFGLLGDIETETAALGPLNTAASDADSDATATAAAVSAMESDFQALTATYNAAATALANATAPTTTAMDAAVTAAANAQTALTAAQDKYAAAKIVFEADPDGSTDTDGADGVYTGQVNDFDVVSDFQGEKTYMEVKSWVETSLNSGVWLPAELHPTQYQIHDATDLSTYLPNYITALTTSIDGTVVDAAGTYPTAIYDFTYGGDSFVYWEQDGSYTTEGTATGTGRFSLTDAELNYTAQTPSSNNIQVITFIEVEADDTSTSNLYLFNVATNELGNDDFTDRDIIGDITDPDHEVALTDSDASARYDNTPDGDGETSVGNADWSLTAQAVAWNTALDAAVETFDYNEAVSAFGEIQGTYDTQKELFDNGLANIAALQVLDDAADAAVTAANDAVTAQQAVIDLLEEQLGVEYAYDEVAVTGRMPSVATNLPFSADVHANDGLAIGSEMYQAMVTPTSGNDWVYDADVDSDDDTLTAYAILWNAQNAYEDFCATTLASLNSDLAAAQTVLDNANLEVPEHVLLVAEHQATLDALQAEYDAFLLTPLYAALEVAKIEATQAWQALVDEDAAATQLVSNLTRLNNVLDNTTTDWASLITTAEGNIAAWLLDIEEKETEILEAADDLARVMTDTIEGLKADIAELEAKIATYQALADKYKALMEAALAS